MKFDRNAAAGSCRRMRRCARGTGRRHPNGACAGAAAATRAAARGRSTGRRSRRSRRSAVGEIGRVQVQQPYPVDPSSPRPRPAARWPARRRPGRVRSTRGPGRRARSRARRARRPRRGCRRSARALLATEARDGAEAAGPIATFGDLDVRPRCSRLGRGGSAGPVGYRGLVAQRDRHRLGEARDGVDFGQRVRHSAP